MITLKEFVSEHYPNGFRADSIEMARLMGKYTQHTGHNLSKEKFNEQMHQVLADTLQYNNQFFFIPTTEPLAILIDHAIDEGYCLFFYITFQQKHRNKLADIRIHSPEILKAILEQYFPYLICQEHYFFYEKEKNFTVTNNTNRTSIDSFPKQAIRNELLHCFTNGNIIVSYTQFAEQTYIPSDEIKNFLSVNNEFVRHTEGCYTHLSFVDFGNELQNGKIIRTIVDEQIEKQGFANTLSPEFLNAIKEITENNPNLSQFAIRDAVYQKFLANDFLIKGNNITLKNQGKLTGSDLLRNYISGKDEVLFSELSELCDKYLGKFHNDYAIRIGNEMMVRIDADKFISEMKIKFDTDKIDKILAQLCPNDYIPLKAVKYFYNFPSVGIYPWNLYLLESYVRKFSEIFRFEIPASNNQNVGVILRKNSVFTSYKQITNDAIIQAGIVKSDKNNIYNFLIESGYICRRCGIWTI
jgi:predicted GNAT family acetyltransferase